MDHRPDWSLYVAWLPAAYPWLTPSNLGEFTGVEACRSLLQNAAHGVSDLIDDLYSRTAIP
jgi:hypothetical protein